MIQLSKLLGSSLNATTNPNPNTLAVVSPYVASTLVNPPIDATWTAQVTGGKCGALFPLIGNDPDKPIRFHVVASGGAAVTYTLTVHFLDQKTATWASPAVNGSFSYTGNTIDTIEFPGHDPIYLEISNLSSGTLSIYVDGSMAEVH